MVQREFINARQVNIDAMEAHLHLRKTRLRCKELQLRLARDLSRRAEAAGGFARYESSESRADGFMICADAIPHAEREAAPMVEHATHLAQREQLVGKELKSLLTQNHVKARIRQSRVKRAALEPFDRCAGRGRKRARNQDHSRVQIDTNDASAGTGALRRDTSDDARSASNVQHALAGRHPTDVHQQWRPRAENISGGAALVAFGSFAAELELFARIQVVSTG